MPNDSEPPIREFADRGTLWLLESPQNLRDLLHLVAAEIAERLDVTRAERINRSFIPDDLQKEEADLLYRIPYREHTSEVLVYVLVEHQSRPDRLIGLRLLSYLVEIWNTQRRQWEDSRAPQSEWRFDPVIPLVFYTGNRRWASSLGLESLLSLPESLAEFVPRYRTLFLSLPETAPERLTGSAIGWALRALQSADASQEALSSILGQATHYLETLPAEAWAEWKRAMRYLLLLVRHKREPAEREALYEIVRSSVHQRHAKEIEEMVRTDAQMLIAEGEAKGREEGREEGRLEGRRAMLRAQLEFKFGPLPAASLAALESLPEPQLGEAAQRLLVARTLADVGI